jgi:outer membrane PBP1 activator LpoA protein
MTLSMLTRFIKVVLVAAFISSCATTTTKDPDPKQRFEIPLRSVNVLLMRAEQSDDILATTLRLSAALIAFDLGEVLQAQRILELIVNPHLTSETSINFLTLRAAVAIANQEGELALSLRADNRLQKATLTQDYQISIGRLRSDAYYLSRSYIASARERIYIDQLLSGRDRENNQEVIFSTLLEMPARSLASQASKAITSDLRGWLALAALTRQYQNDPLRQLQELNKWQTAWSHHPAAARLPASLNMLSRIVSEQPSKIALLLPLQGEFGAAGKAIRDGFLAAHYEQGSQSTIIIYDSTTENVLEIAQRAKADGIELIVGPLAKESVARIAALELQIPILALNRSVDQSLNPNLYQFGLAPEDEIKQVVQQAQREALKHALVIYPENEWGFRNFQTFEMDWAKTGGTIVDIATFTNQRDYSEMVKALLNIDDSEKRSNDLRRIIGERFEFTPRRRQDIHFIFLLAYPNEARGINPTLGHFYAEDIPVYATSHIYEFSESWIEAIDLDGIRFCDIPWKLTSFDAIQTRIKSTWSGAKGQLAPFYAVGLDAHQLYPRLQQLKEIPDERLFGATGVLRLNRDNVIERELMWAQFKDGTPRSTPIIVQ